MIPSLLGRRLRLLFSVIVLTFTVSLMVAGKAPAQGAQQAGIQTHLMWSRYADDTERQMDRAKEAGAHILRVDVGWASMELDGKGQYNQWYLRRLDNVVAQAEARGLQLLVTFWETPCWASTAPESAKQGCAGQWWDREVQRYAPVNAADYAEAFAYVVDRYKGRVPAWEIWNEPNHSHYFKADDVVRRYADLVKAGYPAAKAADPQATIIAGSLADADFAFTQALLDRGIAGHFDAYSVHPYSGDRSPLDRGDDRWIQNSFLRGVPAVRETLMRAGQDVPIWLTEFGWSTCTIRDQQSYANCVDPDVQARHLTQAFTQMRAWSYVKAGFWFNLQDTSDAIDDRVENYGLLRTNGTAKPAFHAFANAARDLAGGPLPGADDGSGTGSDAGTRSGSGDLKTEASGRLTLRAKRKGKRVQVSGSGPRGRTVRIAAYRYLAPRNGFASRSSYRITVRVDRRGRYSRLLRKSALRRGRWRITAQLTGIANARFARVHIGSRPKRSR